MHKMTEAADISTTRHPVFFIVDVGRMVEARGEGNSISAQHNTQLNALSSKHLLGNNDMHPSFNAS